MPVVAALSCALLFAVMAGQVGATRQVPAGRGAGEMRLPTVPQRRGGAGRAQPSHAAAPLEWLVVNGNFSDALRMYISPNNKPLIIV